MTDREWFYKSIYYPYSRLFIILFGIDTFVFGNLAVLLSLVPDYGKTSHSMSRIWSWLNLKLSGIKVEVEGLENIDTEQHYIMMSNHQSHVDIWAMFHGIPLQLRWVMKKELRKIPVFGYACEKQGHIYIDRNDYKSAIKSLDESVRILKKGISVMFFPEGTRSSNGELLPFKKGGFMMATRTKTPILPISISGSRFALPKGTTRIRPGKVKIVVHPPIPTESLKTKDKKELINKVKAIIQSGIDNDYGRI